jgi:hypothetical protein
MSATVDRVDCEITRSHLCVASPLLYSQSLCPGRPTPSSSPASDGEIWTAGANAATTLAVSKDVTINGQPVPKGKYSVWIAISRGDWEMIFDRDTALFHTQGPRHRANQLRFSAPREKRPFMEVLTWWFPEVSNTGMTLAMQWDTVYVPLRIAVTPSYTTKVPADIARQLVGRYQVHFEMPPPPPDTTLGADSDQPPTNFAFTIRYEDGELRAVMDPPMAKTESGYTDWVLIPTRRNYYYLGRIDGRQLVEIFDFATLRFTTSGDRVTGFEERMANDMLMATAKRVP